MTPAETLRFLGMRIAAPLRWAWKSTRQLIARARKSHEEPPPDLTPGETVRVLATRAVALMRWVRIRLIRLRELPVAFAVRGFVGLARSIPDPIFVLLVADFTRFLVTWTAAWLVVWWLVPDLLVGSVNGLSVVFQVVPAVIVAIYVLVVGSLFAMAQLLVSALGGRGPMLMAEDPNIVASALRPALIAVAALLLAGQVPDTGAVSSPLAAAAEVLILATVVTSLRCAATLATSGLAFTGTRTLMLRTLEPVAGSLAAGYLTNVRWRIAMLEQGAKLAFRRGDSTALNLNLEGIARLLHTYVDVASVDSSVRGFWMGDEAGFAYCGWAALDGAKALQGIAEETFHGQAPSDDNDTVVSTMESIAHYAIRHGLLFEAWRFIRGLIMLGCTTHQVTPQFRNALSRPVGSLGRLEATCEQAGAQWLTAYTLAGWGLCVAYFDGHMVSDPTAPLGQHPLWSRSIASFGPAPPWMEARDDVMNARHWQECWANQIKVSLQFVAMHVALARVEYEEVRRGRPPPPVPSWVELVGPPPTEPTEGDEPGDTPE